MSGVWSNDSLYSLTLPSDASSTDPRIVIGPDVPSELVSFYGPATASEGVVAAIVKYNIDPFFPNVVIYHYEALLNWVQGLVVYGFVYDGDVHEVKRDRQSGGGWVETRHAQQVINAKANILIEHDVSYEAPFGSFRVDMANGIKANSRQLVSNKRVYNAQGPGVAFSTNSAAYVNMGTHALANFNKIYAASSTTLIISIQTSFYAAAAGTGAEFGVLVNGVDYTVCGLRATLPPQPSHVSVAGTIKIPTGTLASGTYTITVRWRRVGAVNNILHDVGDWISLIVSEEAND